MKILIIEDNTKLAGMLKKGLEHEGYVADVVHNGLQGYERLLSARDVYNLVLLDLMLPDKDGIGICTDWRAAGVSTPILMLTARSTTDDTVQGLDAGADDYLVKPFEFAELLARVRALARRPQQVTAGIVNVGPFSIDDKAHVITVGNQTPTFTLQEYRMLSLLVRHNGQVLSRSQILSSVWDQSYDGFSNVIDVHMLNLRKKLKKYGKCIKTVRGIGYKLEA